MDLNLPVGFNVAFLHINYCSFRIFKVIQMKQKLSDFVITEVAIESKLQGEYNSKQ
jgi:hypothetical protein